jgi:hypothetical protein
LDRSTRKSCKKSSKSGMLGKGKKMRTAVEVEIQKIHSRTDMVTLALLVEKIRCGFEALKL